MLVDFTVEVNLDCVRRRYVTFEGRRCSSERIAGEEVFAVIAVRDRENRLQGGRGGGKLSAKFSWSTADIVVNVM